MREHRWQDCTSLQYSLYTTVQGIIYMLYNGIFLYADNDFEVECVDDIASHLILYYMDSRSSNHRNRCLRLQTVMVTSSVWLNRFPVKSSPVKSALVKSAPSQNGLKMKVKSTTYFKLNKKWCINMNSYFLLKDSCIILFFLMNRFFFMDEIN
jgi:hypothetical protein